MSNPTRAADFVGSIGVNVHMAYNDGKYADYTKVISDLKYLGINTVRDHAPTVWYQSKADNAMASAGIKFDFSAVGNQSPTQFVSAVTTFAQAHPGSVIALEGLNEINNWPVSYGGLTGTAGALSYMTALTKALAGSAALSGIDTYGLTGANLVQNVDFANMHAYPKEGFQPIRTLLNAVRDQTSAMPNKPMVLTEAGYYTAPASSNWGGVDQPTQAKMTLNLLMDASKLGVSQTYLYQLLDAYPDPTKLNIDKNNGLFDIAGNPKQVATAIHNLTTILADTGANASTFTTHALSYTVANLPTEGSVLALQKSNGKTDLVAWSEPDIWDQINHHSLTAAAKTLTFDFGSNHVSIAVFDPLKSASPIATYADVTSVKVNVVDHPVIVEVTDIPDSGNTTAPISGMTPAAPVPAPTTSSTILASNYSVDAPSATLLASLDASGASAGSGTFLSTNLSTTYPDYLGGAGQDQVYGNGMANVIVGRDGNDILYGGGGDDKMYGGAGNDVMDGGNGHNILYGSAGNDRIYGGQDGSKLIGGSGNDTIMGGAGSDLIIGGTDADVMTGNGGVDTFSFAAGHSAGLYNNDFDRIVDWHSDDRLNVGIIATSGNYRESTATGLADARADANALFAAGTVKLAAAQVGSDVFIFAETNSAHAGYDLSFELNNTNLSSVGYATFV